MSPIDGTGTVHKTPLTTENVVLITQEGLSSDEVLPVFEDHEGNLWAGTDGGGLNRLRNGKIATYTAKSGLSDNLIFSICQDRKGGLWIGTRHGLTTLKMENSKFIRRTPVCPTT